jgi:hypothetical protein
MSNFDIHISKLAIAKQHYVKVGKTYKCLVFPTNLGNNSLNFFLEKINNFGHKCILNLFNHMLKLVKHINV